MPYPNNFGEQFTPEKMPVGLPWRVLIFAFVLFAVSLFVYFGLRLGYEPYLDGRAETFDKNLAELTKSVNLEDQDRFINFYSQLANLKTVLDNHPFPSNVFTYLEKNTIAGVSYSEAKMDITQRTLHLEGLSRSIQALAEQVAVLEKTSETASVLAEQVNVVPNGAAFTISIIFKPEFFQRPI